MFVTNVATTIETDQTEEAIDVEVDQAKKQR